VYSAIDILYAQHSLIGYSQAMSGYYLVKVIAYHDEFRDTVGNTRLGKGIGFGFRLGFRSVLGVVYIIKYYVECNMCIICTTLWI